MARIRSREKPRTGAEVLTALTLPPGLPPQREGNGDVRVWDSVYLRSDGSILLKPIRLGAAALVPPGYKAALRRLLGQLRRRGFPVELSGSREIVPSVGKIRRL